MMRHVLSAIAVVLLAFPALAQREFGFDNTKPSGQPYLTPDETVKRMKVAPEFEVKLFAGEPQVVNPVAFTIDEKGRVWVVECFEYPSRTPPGKAPRDRIVILEDTDGDGACDKRTVFCEGKDFPVPEERKKKGLGAFDLCTGLEVGHGGVYVGAAPYLWFIENKNDKPGKFETLLGGFGSQDTHETLNTFQWGPDGWLYGCHGIFTQSDVTPTNPSPAVNPSPQPPPQRGGGRNPLPPSALGKGAGGLGEGQSPVKINGGVWRFHPRTKIFEVFAEGTSNPWGMDWRNTDGQFILACCVIPHLYHIVPGGIYKRQAGASYNPYVYSYINEICDHTFHRESGWAHAGLISLDVPHMPEKYRNSVVFGSIHGCSIKQNILKPNGSSYTASKGEDFLVSGDKNFRPINLRWGPNGDIYCIDWHDQNPCHQAQAGSWDYDRGRVYRIQLKGTTPKKVEDLGKLTRKELENMAVSSNRVWEQRTALHLLSQIKSQQQESEFNIVHENDIHRQLRLFASLLGNSDYLDVKDDCEIQLLMAKVNTQRAAVYRILGSLSCNGDELARKIALEAEIEPSPVGRRELAAAAIRLSHSKDTTSIIHSLLLHKEDANDPLIPHLTWIAYEKVLSKNPHEPELAWLAANAPGNPFITDQILPKVMRRLVATGKGEDLALCLKFVGDVKDATARKQALTGLSIALKDQMVDAPAAWTNLQTELRKDESLTPLLNQLAVSFRDPEALKRAHALVHNLNHTPEQQAEGIRQMVQLRHPEAYTVATTALVFQREADAFVIESARQLANFDQPNLAEWLVNNWPRMAKGVHGEVVNSMSKRKPLAKALLTAMKNGKIDRTLATDNTIIRIQAFNDRELNALIETAWGKTRRTPAELQSIIDKTLSELDATPASFARGKAVFDNQCAKCHVFDGRGQTVGPPLDGAGRDIEYLLANVIDPNRVIGAPYFLRTATLLDGRVEQGVLAEEDDRSITLKVENGVLKKLLKKDLDGPVKVQEKSMMPEGLTAGMTPADFRDLVRYVMVNPFVAYATVNGQATPGGVTGKIPLPAKAGDVDVVFTVIAPDKLETRLQIGVTDDVAVMIGDKPIAELKGTGKRAAPDQLSVPVTLEKGKTTFTVRVKHKSAGEAVYLRFSDPDRKLRYEGE
jgi:putative membrane-bound dehydrogenase-like protein